MGNSTTEGCFRPTRSQKHIATEMGIRAKSPDVNNFH